MYQAPTPNDPPFKFFFESSDKFGCQDSGYRRPQQCVIPTPVFRSEAPLFSYHSSDDSARGPAESDAPGPSRSELERLSTRPYSVRSSDPEDFAHVWERTIVPVVLDILQAHCDCDFSIDVHNFPELSSESVPRVIYITLPVPAPVELQELVREELSRKVPARFHRTHLKFRQGSLKRAQGLPESAKWWGTDSKHIDPVCEPRNSGFQPIPTIGMSIGPRCSNDAGSVGGFVRVGGNLYALSSRHVFETGLDDGDPEAVHPANGDHQSNLSLDPRSQQTPLGSLYRWSKKASTRISLTFDGSGISANHNRVEMDWCLVGPVPEAKNFLPVPCFDMNRFVVIDRTAPVEANTEVYALARTSGYSLGFTSDVPGVLRIEGVLRREWTVRQYGRNKWDPSIHLDPPWQALKQWVTSGIGVPGDSGAWLMRRSDNAVIGQIWARTHNYGSPVERVRLTYMTPIIDILADIKEKVQDEVALPSYSEAEVQYDPGRCRSRTSLGIGHSAEPWNPLSSTNLGVRRREEEAAIRSGIFNGDFRGLSSGNILYPRSNDECRLPGSCASTSVRVSVSRSNTPESFSPSCPTVSYAREMILLGIGADARFQLGRSDWVAPPSLEMDSSSETLDELDSLSSNGSIRVTVQGELDDEEHFANVEDPVRSKASFQRVGPERKLLIPRPLVT